MALSIKQAAPDFTLPSTSGESFTLSVQMADKACILYFYPKDFTSVCTAEACEFRDEFADFKGLDVEIIGISRDDIATHKKFKGQHKLPFDLLSDEKGEVCKLYDALVPILKIPKRITYLLDNQHIVRAVYDNMFDAQHSSNILKNLKK
jgi:thioredoxin-dependent peroxiredoxin